MKKKLLALSIALISAISISACGRETSGKSDEIHELSKNEALETVSKAQNSSLRKYTNEEIDENHKKSGNSKNKIISKHGSISVGNAAVDMECRKEEENYVTYYQMETPDDLILDAVLPSLSLDYENGTFSFVYDESGEKVGDYRITYPDEDTKANCIVICTGDDGSTYTFVQSDEDNGLLFDSDNSSTMPLGDDIYSLSNGTLFLKSAE